MGWGTGLRVIKGRNIGILTLVALFIDGYKRMQIEKHEINVFKTVHPFNDKKLSQERGFDICATLNAVLLLQRTS